MKLKSLIAFAGVVCAAASYGVTTSVETGNELCRIKFTTSEKEVLIGLPLVDVGGTTQTINATNYIMAVGLPNDTVLLGKVDGKWYSWKVVAQAWTSVSVVGDDNVAYAAGKNASFQRGGAVRLRFPNKPDTSQAVYLYGQVANTSTTGTPATVAGRNAEMPTYTLLSNINAASIAIASLPITGQVKGDKIAVLATGGVGQKEYTWDGEKWTEMTANAPTTAPTGFPSGWTVGTATTPTQANKTFVAGEGFFYITATNGTSTAATFNWGSN